MFCIRCGVKNEEAATLCRNCGAAMVRPSEPAPPSNYPYPLPPLPASENSPAPLPIVPPTAGYPYASPPPSYPPNYFAPPTTAYPYGQASQPGPSSGYVADGPVSYGPAAAPFGYNHPLLLGATGLPYQMQQQPQSYYSYLNPQGRVVLARRTSFLARLGANLVDTIILLVPILLLVVLYLLSLPPGELGRLSRAGGSLNVPSWLNALTYLFTFGYFFLFTASRGQTPGKRLLKIKVIRLDGQKPDWLTSLLRQSLGYTLSAVPCLLGYFWAGIDSQKQAWHDKLARTLVVDTRLLEEGRDFILPNRPPQ